MAQLVEDSELCVDVFAADGEVIVGDDQVALAILETSRRCISPPSDFAGRRDDNVGRLYIVNATEGPDLSPLFAGLPEFVTDRGEKRPDLGVLIGCRWLHLAELFELSAHHSWAGNNRIGVRQVKGTCRRVIRTRSRQHSGAPRVQAKKDQREHEMDRSSSISAHWVSSVKARPRRRTQLSY